MSSLADRIIEAMDKAGVSITQVAAACDVSYQASENGARRTRATSKPAT